MYLSVNILLLKLITIPLSHFVCTYCYQSIHVSLVSCDLAFPSLGVLEVNQESKFVLYPVIEAKDKIKEQLLAMF